MTSDRRGPRAARPCSSDFASLDGLVVVVPCQLLRGTLFGCQAVLVAETFRLGAELAPSPARPRGSVLTDSGVPLDCFRAVYLFRIRL